MNHLMSCTKYLPGPAVEVERVASDCVLAYVLDAKVSFKMSRN